MKKLHFSWLAPLALLSLGACAAAPFRADVSRFQQMPAPQGQSFAIKAADAANDGGLEFAQYAGLVAGQLQKAGYVAAAPGASADFTVTLGYTVDQGKERTVVERDPFYDPWWGYGNYQYGRRGFYGGRGRRFVGGWYDPFLYGGLGFDGAYDVHSFMVFTSGLDMKIARTDGGEHLFEGKAEAKSRSNRLPYLVPNLVEAMFSGFPGNSGETVRISVAPEAKK